MDSFPWCGYHSGKKAGAGSGVQPFPAPLRLLVLLVVAVSIRKVVDELADAMDHDLDDDERQDVVHAGTPFALGPLPAR